MWIKYLATKDRFIGEMGYYTWDELERIDAIRREWQLSLPDAEYELAEGNRSLIQSLIKQYKRELATIGYIREDIKNNLIRDGIYDEIATSILLALTGHLVREIELKKHIARLTQVSFHKKNANTDDIKLIPITHFIKFNSARFAPCIWHNEKTPSLKYYPHDNHVYCFGCNKRGDVIDVIMQKQGVSFIGALTFLGHGN